ncbi:hypothetical protein NLJ89_g2093 [Agrocybe chaxingu]|uniref:Uncharacterized protein n=1 Tax=Agrocybe chaxingu TaxID=84603 RepID=A0A9W8K527_9AGAR|nr:hypothetical protein NLJ89_g2093 [Agrocybe chaxingu]
MSTNQTVVIVGAGFGGIAAAIHLKDKLGFKDFVILEKSSGVGGTWRGCLSDVVIHYYSLSTDLKHDWENLCEFQPNILKYVEGVTDNHSLRHHMVFSTEVISAEWQEDAQFYTVETRDTKTGAPKTWKARIIISAHGILHIPKMPAIPGLENFKGTVMHSARWDKSVDLRGKRVAVIGNGSSGAQIMSNIPAIEGIQVTQFYRTRNWHLPGFGRPMSGVMNWALTHVPFLSVLFRWFIFWVLLAASTRSTAPKEYHDILIPSFPVGCRRIIYGSTYFSVLRRPNVGISRSGIASVYSNGVITEDGKSLPFDVIICATGFVVDTFPYGLRGRETTIQEFYASKGGPNAYLGTTIPGFPNFCTLGGYTSVLFFEECQMQYIGQLIKPILDGAATSFEVTSEANDAYNDTIQEGMKHTPFTFCRSWYRVGGSGKNSSIFPGSAITFWWWCQSVDWRHYKIKGLKAGVSSLQQSIWLKDTVFVSGASLLALSAAYAYIRG